MEKRGGSGQTVPRLVGGCWLHCREIGSYSWGVQRGEGGREKERGFKGDRERSCGGELSSVGLPARQPGRAV